MNHLAALNQTFAAAHQLSRNLLRSHISRQDGDLRPVMDYCIRKQTTSDYPFVFRYAFSRKEADAKRITVLSAAIHLLQSSGFITDDIFDHSPFRYGAPAVHVRFGVTKAIIAAQMMQSIALEVISAELRKGRFSNHLEVMLILNRIIRELYIGQYLDVFHSGNIAITMREYHRVIALGVGRYYGHVAQCGALLAGKDPAEVKALTSFGYHYGMAVFITDDILDIEAKPKRLHLVAGSDLMQRRMRLPMIFALRQAKPSGVARLRSFLKGKQPPTAGELSTVTAIIVESGALESCRRQALRHIAASRRSLVGLRNELSRERLRWLADTLLLAQGLEP